jgi:uncharacterized protein (TIGR02452 family)
MNRANRAAIAQQTLTILEDGGYAMPGGATVAIAQDLRNCVDTTQLFWPDELKELTAGVLSRPSASAATIVEVENESTLSAIARLLHGGCAPVAALNFASAKNPGGGFLSGSQAQEESLARSSGLYASLSKARAFYAHHRGNPSPLYSDAMILSPNCPVFRDDTGSLLNNVHHATFISSPAPNAGVVRERSSHDLELIPDILRRRAEYVLSIAASRDIRYLVLGAWGCGVFRNDPRLVARVFMSLLASADWQGRFSKVVFSVLDTAPESELIRIFRAAATENPIPPGST